MAAGRPLQTGAYVYSVHVGLVLEKQREDRLVMTIGRRP